MRLTVKDNKNAYGYYPKETDYDLCCNKLGQLEDIEEELGIDLITLYKALENGICFLFNSGIVYRKHVVTDMKQIGVINDRGFFWLNFKDYGKTWALTKEELENV